MDKYSSSGEREEQRNAVIVGKIGREDWKEEF